MSRPTSPSAQPSVVPHAVSGIGAQPSMLDTAPSKELGIPLNSINRVSRTYYGKREQAKIYSSRQRAINVIRQADMRRDCCEVIAQIGNRIGFPRRTISTAQLLLHRFYMFNAVADTSNEVVMACLFVSSKVEDTIKKLKDIMTATYYFRHPEVVDWDSESKEGEEQRKRILTYEKSVLESICFDFQIQHPYDYVIKFVKSFSGPRLLAKRAWFIASDSFKIGVCLEYPAHVIAAGSIFLAAKILNLAFPETIHDQPWTKCWKCRMVDIEDFCHQMLDLYAKTASDEDQRHYTLIQIGLNEAQASEVQLLPARVKRARLTYEQPTGVTAELGRIEDGGALNPTVRYLAGGRKPGILLREPCCGQTTEDLKRVAAQSDRDQNPPQQFAEEQPLPDAATLTAPTTTPSASTALAEDKHPAKGDQSSSNLPTASQYPHSNMQ